MDDIVDPAILEQALAQCSGTSTHRVYFDTDTGSIFKITNEPDAELEHYVEFASSEVESFLNGSRCITDFKIIFVSELGTPVFVRVQENVDSVLLTEVPDIDDEDAGFVIENFPKLQQWSFRISPAKKVNFKNFSLSTLIEVFIVDVDNNNYLYRTIKLSFADLIKEERVLVNHAMPVEANTKRVKVLTNKFFLNFGYKVAYDTES